MALIYDGQVYRNLQEQVIENTKDIEDLQESGGTTYEAGTGISITDNTIAINSEVVALKNELFSGSYRDLTNKPDLSVYAQSANLALVATTGSYTNLTDKPVRVSDFYNDSGYITGITYSDVIDALGYTPGDSSFDGDYYSLRNRPTIPTKVSELTNDSGFITGITATDIRNALGYTPGESDFSGSYLDLTDTPDLSVYVEKPEGAQSIDLIPIVKKLHTDAEWIGVSYEAASLKVARWNGNSQLETATPTEDTHAANKKYVDDAIATAITSAIGGSY